MQTRSAGRNLTRTNELHFTSRWFDGRSNYLTIAIRIPQDSVSKPLHWLDLAKIRSELKKMAGRSRCLGYLWL